MGDGPGGTWRVREVGSPSFACTSSFLAHEVPLIEASPAYGSNGVIVVVYDEDERALGMSQVGFGQGGHVVCAIISPLAVPGSYSGTFYHYSLLRTLEDGFGLPGYVGDANSVTPINTIWGG